MGSERAAGGAALLTFDLVPGQVSAHVDMLGISQVAGVAEDTIRSAYRELHADAEELVPSWYATANELARLPNPMGRPRY
jgi:hypothetical protein